MGPKRVLWATLALALLAGCDEPTPPPASATGPAADIPAGVLRLPDNPGARQAPGLAAAVDAITRIADGRFEVQRVEAPGVALIMVRVATDTYPGGIAVANDLEGGRRGVTVAAAVERGAQVIVGSSFVSQIRSMTPVGLLQIDGEEVSPIQPHGYRRVLGFRPDGVGVVGHRQFHPGMFDSALQAGPGVVEQGLLDITERDLQRTRYFRAFVATCGAHAVAGITLAPSHLFTLGQVFLETSEAQGWACDEVVNLAGDREAVLAVSNGEEVAYIGHLDRARVALVTFGEG